MYIDIFSIEICLL